MTDSNSPTEEPTFICQRCMERLPISARFADDEPFDVACYAANQDAEAARQAEEQARQEALVAEQPAEEDDGQGQLFQ